MPTFEQALVVECQARGVGPCRSILHFKSNLMPPMQSAYRRHHLTETTLFRVFSDILSSADEGKVTLLDLLDILSAAFNMVDHTILLDLMRVAFGIDGLALEWIRTFLVDRTQQVLYMGQLSSTSQPNFGIPKRSVFVPLLFLLYTAE